MIALENIASLAWRHWRLIAEGIGLAVLGFLLWSANGRADREAKRADKATTAYQLEVAKHAVSLASIASLTDIVRAKNAESDARAKALADSRAGDARDVAAADARQRADGARRAALEAIAKGKSGCAAPAALIRGLEGL